MTNYTPTQQAKLNKLQRSMELEAQLAAAQVTITEQAARIAELERALSEREKAINPHILTDKESGEYALWREKWGEWK